MFKLKYLPILFSLLIMSAYAENTEKIIENLKKTKNINFDFEQNINQKIENGNCTIEYPKKIFCEYLGNNNKIIVSNGESLIIRTSASYYRYPLKKTHLNYILDKNFLINKISNLKGKIINGSYLNYSIIEGDNEINILFDNKFFNLIGWQTKDIYQNVNITFLSSIKRNQKINKNLFNLPTQN